MNLRPRILGERCKDEGKCHHACNEKEGCFREACCGPLTASGLDDDWRTPQERAKFESRQLQTTVKACFKQTGSRSL